MIPLLLLALPAPQDAPEKLRIEADLWLAYAVADGALVDAQDALLAGAPMTGARAVDWLTGRARVRFDIEASPRVSAVVELESRSRDLGLRLGFGRDDENEILVAIEQAYLRVRDLLFDGDALLFGAQDLRYRLRPHGEAVLLDVTESESAWAGINAAGTALRNVTFPDTLEPAGFVYRVDRRGGWRVDLFALKILDNASGTDAGGAPTRDEAVYGIYFDAIPDPERLKVFAVLALLRGGMKGANVWTFGLGADAYFGADKEWEVFAEVFFQRGDFARGIDKAAEAVLAGARWVAPIEGGGTLAIEASGFLATGDRDAADGKETSFQSHESMNRLAILQSDEWGLDIDTNYRVYILSTEARWEEIDLALHVGWARLDFAPLDPAGVRYTDERKLGMEVDLVATWRVDGGAAELFAIAAWLGGSKVLDALTGEDSALLFVAGGRVAW
jgi:hypothetical protein